MKRLDIPISAAVKCIMQLSVDSSQLLDLRSVFGGALESSRDRNR